MSSTYHTFGSRVIITEEVSKQNVIANYTNNMDGVDKADQYASTLFPEKIVETVAEIVPLGTRNKRNKCLCTLQDFSGKERRKRFVTL